jgi:hypothetical protein
MLKLKKLRDEMKQIKENGEKNAVKLGLPSSSDNSYSSVLSNYHSDSSSDYSREIVNILQVSERHLDNIYEVLKLNKGKKLRRR